ncbi:MAG: hypothetical protein KatS3mg014_0633 [Actinomycetota bacterium]|nr:MAG: hypothetical protein KatS3mg014_0633 [Actinomycetota bacterium]
MRRARGVALFDYSSFTQFLVQGPDAEPALQRLCTADVAVPVGRLVYTQMLNERGGIEADVTVTRLAEDRYLVVGAAAEQRRDLDWLERNLRGRVAVTDVSSGYCTLAVMGPRSRELLAGLTTADLSNEAFPFLASREIDLGHVVVRASRVSYVGELGYELMVPTEFGPYVFDLLAEAGRGVGLRLAGFHALNSLRLEKAYRLWGYDMGSHDTPLEAGLGFTVAWDKAGGFLGRDALLRQREAGGPATARAARPGRPRAARLPHRADLAERGARGDRHLRHVRAHAGGDRRARVGRASGR